ncbi:MEDS domain-containing protein [Caldimonas tepidiphila]|uniref:MEDS domain-containing protein n=1 Tax=Caldimonas tepidiphila TaxID=2315841 RepID=UPI000E5A2F24|nr:MEDS domain-containing protein [Caldimonas tepidiphila]
MKPITLAGKDVTPYNHVCAFFDSRQEEYEILAPFSKDGLENGEKAIHIVDPARIQEHLQQLKEHGIDSHGCHSCGQLDVLSWDDVYLSDGTFNQDRMVGAIDSVLEAGRAAGFPKVRLWANMGWTLKGCPGTDEVMEFESRVNEVLSRSRQLAICVYDMSKISGALMMDILRSHPLTLIGNVIHENPFYTPPEQLVQELRARRLASPQATAVAEAA